MPKRTLQEKQPWNYLLKNIYIKRYCNSFPGEYLFYLFIFVEKSFFFYFKYFVKGNERWNPWCKSDEMLCLCVRFENSNLQRFKLKTTVAFEFRLLNELEGNLNSKEYIDLRK